MQDMAGIAAAKLVALRFLEPEPSQVRRHAHAAPCACAGDVPARGRELARFTMPLRGAPLPFDPRLMPHKLLFALGEVAAEVPLHPVGEP